jgi:hypothetical protein
MQRGFDMALGKEPFNSRIALRGLRRELALDRGCAERKEPFAERMFALSESPESGSENRWLLLSL